MRHTNWRSSEKTESVLLSYFCFPNKSEQITFLIITKVAFIVNREGIENEFQKRIKRTTK